MARARDDAADLVERCRRVPSATWSDALDLLGLEGILPGLRHRSGHLPLAGPVVTVDEEVGSFGSAGPEEFGIQRILVESVAGQVILVRQRGEPPASALGGLAALAARQHGVVGVVVDGACRDVGELVTVGLPVLSRELTPASGRGRVRIASINVPLSYPTFTVDPGDMLVADDTGVVVLPAARLDELLHNAEERVRYDAEQATTLRG